MSVLVLFCGAGGSTVGIHAALPDAEVLGIDNDFDACATHEAAGFKTTCADITTLKPADFAPVDGLWASPPCTDFSRAGKRRGTEGETGHLIYVAMEWAEALHPEWIVFEQVPDVLRYWHGFASMIGQEFSTWVGILNAADYGVPQTRQRAFLLASRVRQVEPPPATHAEHPHPRLDGVEERPWVSMAEALGWDGTLRSMQSTELAAWREYYRRDTDRPSPVVVENASRWVLETNRGQDKQGNRQEVSTDRPTPSVSTKASGQWKVTSNNSVAGVGRAERLDDEPAFSVTSASTRWTRERERETGSDA